MHYHHAAPMPLPFPAFAANAARMAPSRSVWQPVQQLPHQPPLDDGLATPQAPSLAGFCRSANDPVRDAAHHHEARAAESDAQYAAEDAAHRDTLALARGGDYARLLSAMDYRDNDTRAMHALVSCALQGHALAREAIEVLARTWAETHTEAV